MTRWSPRASFGKRFWVGCGLMFLAVSFVVVTLIQSQAALRLARDGITVQATVTHRQMRSAQTDDPRFELGYTFGLDGTLHSHSRTVPETVFADHPTGTTWPIRVLADNPDVHDLYPAQSRGTAWGFMTIALFMGTIGATFTLSNGNLAVLRHRFGKS